MYIGGNLFNRETPNRTASPELCCEMCQRTAGCSFFTHSPKGEDGKAPGSCWLKTAAAWNVRRPAPGDVSGSTRPLPPHRPAPAPPPTPKPPGPGPTSIEPVQMRELAIGAVRPSGWLETQLQLQVDGLSGHLPRFWPDIVNSTWLFPEHRWRETYSDRGGNLPYWLNGVIPLVAQLPPAALVDASGYNLSATVYTFTHQLLAVQEQHWGSGSWVDMSTMFSLGKRDHLHATFAAWLWSSRWCCAGTWNVCRSFMLHASAHPHEAEPFAAFIAKYIAAAHARLLAKGFTAANSVCTQCDSRQPESAPCSEVLNGGMCKPRWPDWAWIVRWRCFLDDLSRFPSR